MCQQSICEAFPTASSSEANRETGCTLKAMPPYHPRQHQSTKKKIKIIIQETTKTKDTTPKSLLLPPAKRSKGRRTDADGAEDAAEADNGGADEVPRGAVLCQEQDRPQRARKPQIRRVGYRQHDVHWGAGTGGQTETT